MPIIDLATLQKECAQQFGLWWSVAEASKAPTSCGLDQQRIALAARTQIYGKVRAAIADDRLHSRGIYLFASLAGPDCLARAVYVGLVNGSRHTLAMRMWDHLAKELSSLNLALADDDQVARHEIEQLLRVVLPRSKRLESYCRKHMKGRAMSCADAILLFPVSAPAAVIDDAESVLIRALVPESGESRTIVNKQKTASSRPSSAEGMALALEAVSAWRRLGLGERAAESWTKRIRRTEHRSVN